MKLCIVGGGPSAFYLTKFLSDHFDIHIYEKSDKPYGLFNLFSHRFLVNPFKKTLEKVKIFYSQDIKKLPDNYDAYIIAIGAKESILNIKGNKYAITTTEAIKKYQEDLKRKTDKNIKQYFSPKDKIIIIGMGNSSLDVAKDLFSLGINKIKILSRTNNYKFTIPEIKLMLRENIEIKVKNTNNGNKEENNTQIKTSPLNTLKEIINSFKINTNKKLSLLFNTEPKIIKKKEELILYTQNKKKYKTNHIISSLGYERPDISNLIEHNKKIYTAGWTETRKGNLTDVFYNCKDTANKILKDFNLK